MTRPRKNRKIFRPPLIGGFLPYETPSDETRAVYLLFEEYEAFRLADYEGLTQQEAAEQMEISTPTFSRVYDVARQKFAKALVEGLVLKIEGGSYGFAEAWYKCNHCHTSFSPPEKEIPTTCPVCRSIDFSELKEGKNSSLSELLPRPVIHRTGFCLCQRCGLHISHQAGIPCQSLVCPSCGTSMIRENHPVAP